MIARLEQHRQAIADLCAKYRVQRLEVFGSAVTDRFDPAHSDIDFFYELADPQSPGLADRFFGLCEDLEKLLGCPVELISSRDVHNPYLLQIANRTRVTLYAA